MFNEYVATSLSSDELNIIHCNIRSLNLLQNEDLILSDFVKAFKVIKTSWAEEDNDDDSELMIQHCKMILNTNVKNFKTAIIFWVNSLSNSELRVQNCPTDDENSEIAIIFQIDSLSNSELRIQNHFTDDENLKIATVCQINSLSNSELRIQNYSTDNENLKIATVCQINSLNNSELRVQNHQTISTDDEKFKINTTSIQNKDLNDQKKKEKMICYYEDDLQLKILDWLDNIKNVLDWETAEQLLKNCEHLIISHQFNENEENEKNVDHSDESLICDLHLNKLCMTIEMKKDSEEVILERLQICLENDCDMKKLLAELNIRSWFIRSVRSKLKRNQLLSYQFASKEINCSLSSFNYNEILRDLIIHFKYDDQNYLADLQHFDFIDVDEIMS